MPLASRPQLIFLAGPERGKRALVKADSAVVGRSASADIRVREQYVSREQMQFTLTAEGWVVENLSSRPMHINGKKYKPKQKILLDTGDLIGLGVSTKILYVAPGDDPEEALSAFRESQLVLPGREPQVEEAPVEVAAEAQAEEPAGGRAEAPVGEPKTEEFEQPAEQRKKKYKKYGIMFSIYAVFIIVLIVWLAGRKGGSPSGTSSSGKPAILPDDKIKNVLESPVEKETYQKAKAEKKLAEALSYYRNLRWEPSNPYLCLKRFKEHLGYLRRSTFRENERQHTAKLFEVQEMVVNDVVAQYHKAYLLEKEGNWPDALKAFWHLRRMVPEEQETERNDKVHETLIGNVLDHVAYVKRRMREKG
ncbi:MAG: FHA domain-containing protein [Planctomycetota bacterium]|jgi:pSer/pThr/pTyr-binding forkhead associated (FHA) protein